MNDSPAKDLALHCRFAHFTALTVCLALLIAVSFDADSRQQEAFSQVNTIRSIQLDWEKMNGQLRSTVAEKQAGTSRFEALSTLLINGETYDLQLNIDLANIWVPHHKHLYDLQNANHHYDQLAHGGFNLAEFSSRWNWASDLTWIYVPKAIGKLLTVKRVFIADQWFDTDVTMQSTIAQVYDHSQDFTRGNSRFFCIVDVGKSRGRGFLFGNFPSEHAVEVGKSNFSLIGSSGAEPPLYRQVELAMHLSQTYAVRCKDRGPGKAAAIGNPVEFKLVEIKVPTIGEFVNSKPLGNLPSVLELAISPGDQFATTFPAVARLSDAYKNIELGNLVDLLNDQRLSGTDRQIEIFGIVIPVQLLTRWGVLLVLSVFGYFALHLSQLSSMLLRSSSDPGWEVPWIGVYSSKAAFILVIGTTVAVPVVTVIGIWLTAAVSQGILDWMLLHIGLVGILILSAWTVLSYWRIWSDHPQKTCKPEPF